MCLLFKVTVYSFNNGICNAPHACLTLKCLELNTYTIRILYIQYSASYMHTFQKVVLYYCAVIKVLDIMLSLCS